MALAVRLWNRQCRRASSRCCLSSTLAPISGEYGPFAGFVGGMIHLVLVQVVGTLHGGLDLYNNGFAGGLTAGLSVAGPRVVARMEEDMKSDAAQLMRVAEEVLKFLYRKGSRSVKVSYDFGEERSFCAVSAKDILLSAEEESYLRRVFDGPVQPEIANYYGTLVGRRHGELEMELVGTDGRTRRPQQRGGAGRRARPEQARDGIPFVEEEVDRRS